MAETNADPSSGLAKAVKSQSSSEPAEAKVPVHGETEPAGPLESHLPFKDLPGERFGESGKGESKPFPGRVSKK